MSRWLRDDDEEELPQRYVSPSHVQPRVEQ